MTKYLYVLSIMAFTLFYSSIASPQAIKFQPKLEYELMNKAKIEIEKKFPNIKITFLNWFPPKAYATKKDDQGFYPEYFHFQDYNSIRKEKVGVLTVLHFDLISIGVYENGTFKPNVEDIKKTTVTSMSYDGDTNLNLQNVNPDDLLSVYGSFSGNEVDKYYGPSDIKITCVTELEVAKKDILILIEKSFSNKNITLFKTESNKIKAVYQPK